MSVRVAINGFGRIGRNILRAIVESARDDIIVVGINDLGPVETNAHLLRYDSVHGKIPVHLNKTKDGIKYKKPEGSFYAFVDVNGLINKIDNIEDDFDLAEYFLKNANVAVVPGTAFGSKNHIRISFATSLEKLKLAIERIKNLLS